MSQEMLVLLGSAVGIAALHTLVGPDHYVPFIVMSKARQWSRTKTAWITLLCGLGHVGSSIVLGLIGIAAGISLRRLEIIESVRGDIAAWLIIAFGIAYSVWGLRRALRNKPHTHRHAHLDGAKHEHEHAHHIDHMHPHDKERKKITAWVLFTIFVFGPCEPLIPLLMYSAAVEGMWGATIIAIVFSVATIGTMMAAVLLSAFGLGFVSLKRFERYGHVIAGSMISICGIAILFGL